MNPASERSIPYWARSATIPHPAALPGDARTDVLVVGSGIAGLSTAYELASAGRRVIVADRGPIGGGMTARTTAHLASAWDDYFHELVRLRGEAEARLVHESQAAAIDRIEAIQAAERIACDFRRIDGFLVQSPESERDLLDRELEACRAIGLAEVGWAERSPLAGAPDAKCLRFPRQGRVHPLRYLGGLALAIQRKGGLLYANSAITHLEEKDSGIMAHTETEREIRADAVVLATNSPIDERFGIHTKQAPYRSYVVAGRVPASAVPDALIWDTLDPYHYVRLQPLEGDEALLIVGGEDHKTGTARDIDDRFRALETWTRTHFPAWRAAEHRWSGQVYEPVDTIPFVGRSHGDAEIYVVTGDSGQGITTGAMAGMLVRDLILKRDNPWAEIYEPRRKTLRSLGEFVKENVTATKQMAKHLTGGEIGSLDELARGHGAIVREGTRKLAAYRAESGRLYVHSATCTHAGCVVEWNPFEMCWDCPCHGSQFAPEGGVLSGPAIHPLASAE